MEKGPGKPLLRMDWLDYARLICALWVMFDHYLYVALDPRISHGISDYGLATEIARFGPIALFVFFMTSGLVVTTIAERMKASTFVAQRFARIYPTLLLCLTITALVSIFGPEKLQISPQQFIANLAINAPAFGYRYVDAVYWTLILEITFYAALTLVILSGLIKRLQVVVTAWVALQLLCSPWPWPIPLFGRDYYFIAAGSVFALLYQRRNERWNMVLLAVSLGLCIRCAFIYANAYQFNPWIGAAGTIATFGLFLAMRDRHFTLPFAQRIGSLTYPLYLLHFHIGLILLYWWVNEGNKWLLVMGISATMILVSIVIDYVMVVRARHIWVKLAYHSIALPFALWERRAARSSMKDEANPPGGST